MKKLILITLLVSTSCAANRYAVRFDPPERPLLQAQVLKVIDGDTVLVRTMNREPYCTDTSNAIIPNHTNSVRMLFIDAPESSDNVKLERNLLQYFGKGVYVRKEKVIALGIAAKNHLAGFLKPGDPVLLEFPSTEAIDKYGRFLALVYRNGTNANYLMVREGFAVTYFLGPSAGAVLRFYRKSFLAAETAAKNEGFGIWKALQ